MNSRSRFSVILFFFLFGSGMYAGAASWTYRDFYAAMQSNDTLKIISQLSEIEKSSLKEKDAYAGALMMRMSGLVKSGMDKLKIFKQGRVKLEKCIKQDSLNAEYRFLRLIIQEHIPDFMNYHSKRTEDARTIRESYRKLPSYLQDAIRDYSFHSHILKPEDFQK